MTPEAPYRQPRPCEYPPIDKEAYEKLYYQERNERPPQERPPEPQEQQWYNVPKLIQSPDLCGVLWYILYKEPVVICEGFGFKSNLRGP